jgi:DNA-binding GntR family transcriptional regulator
MRNKAADAGNAARRGAPGREDDGKPERSRGAGARARRREPNDAAVYREVSEAIIDHRLPPGTPLPEDGLAAAFGFSRTVIRKALHRLAHEKLVELRPNRGAVVARPSVEEASHVFDARRVIEAAVVADAALGMQATELGALRDLVARERAAAEARDRRTHIRLSGEFHRRLADAAGNQVLADFVGELISRTSLILALYEAPGAALCLHDEHLGVLDAIERGDKEAAQRLMALHLDHLERQLDLEGSERSVDLRRLFAHVRGNETRPAT